MSDLISRSALLEDFAERQKLDRSGGDFADCFINDAQELSTEWWCVEDAVESAPDAKVDGNTSDGYHTFNELYDHRAKLFSVIVRTYRDLCWKSKLHHNGTMYDGMFIVGINTPNGQASYHYDINPYWEMFDCKELDNAPEWDGHTPQQAIDRIAGITIDAVPVVHARWVKAHGMMPPEYHHRKQCSMCGGWALQDYFGRERMSHYCPNCGAKMDGGAEA